MDHGFNSYVTNYQRVSFIHHLFPINHHSFHIFPIYSRLIICFPYIYLPYIPIKTTAGCSSRLAFRDLSRSRRRRLQGLQGHQVQRRCEELTHQKGGVTGWCPPVMERWFIKPMNTIVIGSINHSYWRYLHQLNAIVWGPHFVQDGDPKRDVN